MQKLPCGVLKAVSFSNRDFYFSTYWISFQFVFFLVVLPSWSWHCQWWKCCLGYGFLGHKFLLFYSHSPGFPSPIGGYLAQRPLWQFSWNMGSQGGYILLAWRLYIKDLSTTSWLNKFKNTLSHHKNFLWNSLFLWNLFSFFHWKKHFLLQMEGWLSAKNGRGCLCFTQSIPIPLECYKLRRKQLGWRSPPLSLFWAISGSVNPSCYLPPHCISFHQKKDIWETIWGQSETIKFCSSPRPSLDDSHLTSTD